MEMERTNGKVKARMTKKEIKDFVEYFKQLQKNTEVMRAADKFLKISLGKKFRSTSS